MIGEYPLYVIPFDEDVLSFELDLAYKVGYLLIIEQLTKLTLPWQERSKKLMNLPYRNA